MSARAIAEQVRSGARTARRVIDDCLARIEAKNERLNAFSDVLAEAARVEADAIDRRLAAGEAAGPLAGVPFAVKNLFDVAGLVTRAGSIIEAEGPPAAADAPVVARLRAAGAILVGATNMDEYAYGFTSENTHYGPVRNPRDEKRVAGGSSGGSAAAVGAGLVPLALGSDTNGSIRVPAAFCGILGLKPTYGRLSRRGAFLFVPSLDHVGPFARSVADLALCYDLMQGPDAADPVCRGRPVEPTHDALDDGDEIRIAVADGYYAQSGAPEAHAAVARVAEALSIERRVSLPEPEKARAAAFVITASEGAGQHLDNLRIRAGDFDPMTRDRFLAGALVPAAWVLRAQRFRRRYRDAVAAAFQDVDVVLAPTTPVPAPEIGQETMLLNGVEMPSRPNLGLFTQPLSLIGLPIVSVPVMGEGGLPLGVQVIARPWREDHALKVARAIERAGLTIAPERP